MIDYAINMAKKIPHVKGRQRHFSVILSKSGKIVSQAANSYSKTNPRFAAISAKAGLPDKQCVHSEALALFRDKEKRGVKLVVVRVLADGTPANSKPCKVCEMLIKEHYVNIKSIEYTT